MGLKIPTPVPIADETTKLKSDQDGIENRIDCSIGGNSQIVKIRPRWD